MKRILGNAVLRWTCVVVAIAAVSGASTLNYDAVADASENGVLEEPLAAGESAEPVAAGVLPASPIATEANDTPEPLASVAPSAAAEATTGGDAFGIRFDSDRPVAIRSDALESSKIDGTRKLLFTKNVVMEQDDLTMRSELLEAYYPPEASQPSRLIASGRVSLTNGEYDVRCDQATYERVADTLICRGNAEMREDDDCVAGKWIEFDLNADTVKVGGGATVVLGGENESRGSGVCQ